MSNLYLDLFDDNLYPLGTPAAGRPADPLADRAEHLHAALCTQVLLSIVFGRQIAVPEQWLCSSRVFVVLASDVIAAWRKASADALRKGRNAPQFPFDFSYFPHAGSAEDSLAALAIRERIERNRPLRLSRALSWEAPDDERIPARQSFHEALTDALSGTSPVFGGAFADKVARSTGEPLLAEALSSVLGYMSTGRPRQTVRSLDSYNSNLASAVRSVRNALWMNELRALDEDRTEGFRRFFEEVQKKQIQLHDITGMWQVANQYGDDSLRNTITLMGRYCMHRALGRWTEAGWSAASYSLFSSEHPDGYDHSLLATARVAEFRRQRSDPQTHDFDQLVVSAASDYGNADDLAKNATLMETMWERAFEVARSEKWKAVVDRTKDLLAREKNVERHTAIIRDTLLDELIGAFAEISYANDPSGEALFCAQFPLAQADASKVAKATVQAVIAGAASAGAYFLGLPGASGVVVTAGGALLGEMLGISPRVGRPTMVLRLSSVQRRVRQLKESRGA